MAFYEFLLIISFRNRNNLQAVKGVNYKTVVDCGFIYIVNFPGQCYPTLNVGTDL